MTETGWKERSQENGKGKWKEFLPLKSFKNYFGNYFNFFLQVQFLCSKFLIKTFREILQKIRDVFDIAEG